MAGEPNEELDACHCSTDIVLHRKPSINIGGNYDVIMTHNYNFGRPL